MADMTDLIYLGHLPFPLAEGDFFLGLLHGDRVDDLDRYHLTSGHVCMVYPMP